jgi:hypothetical protein
MSRASTSGISLSKSDAAIIKGMLYRGDRQHDIAAWFGVNGGRIAEISSRRKFSDVLMQLERLPPPGPYLTGKQSHEVKVDLLEALSNLKNMTQAGHFIPSEQLLAEIVKLNSIINNL